MKRTIRALLAVVGLIASGTGSYSSLLAQSHAEPGVLPQRPGVYSFMVGRVRVTALSDGTAAQDYHKLLRGITPAATDAALRRSFEANPVQTSINVFLLRIGGRLLLIDTGTGALFGPDTAGRLPEALAAAGVTPDQIDDVLITHVHPDHVGGLVVNGVRMFGKAVIHVGQPDIDFFVSDPRRGVPHADAKTSAELAAMIRPYLAAGRVKAFVADTVIAPGLTASIHPGHTPGSAFYVLDSEGARIVFVGDIVHAGAVQFASPNVTIMYDAEPGKARSTREAAFAGFSRSRTLLAAPHLSFPGVGHVRRSGSGYEWVPVEFEDWPSHAK